MRHTESEASEHQAKQQPDQDLPLDVLCFSHLRWHFVTQRPQHLLTRCARDRRVFYWEEPYFDADDNGDGTPTLESMEGHKGVIVLRPHLPRAGNADAMQRELLTKFLHEYGVLNFVRWYYTPMALGFTDHIDAAATAYDCMDELTGFLGAPPQLRERESQLMAQADVVFTGGKSLFEAKRQHHGNVHAFPSSIDVAHFAQATQQLDEPSDQAPIAHPRAGFFGVLDERFDAQLMQAVAADRPDIQFVFIGPIVKIDPATLPTGPNVHYLGAKSYAELPSYLAGWDIALIPFALNESTRYISPTKTPEYLAAGKPVVSTPIHDVIRDYGDAGLVTIAASREEFTQALDRALRPPTSEWKQSVQDKLQQTSWDATWQSMWHLIEQSIYKPSGKCELHQVSFRLGKEVKLERFDYIVVGAGFAGAVLAERLANGSGQRVLVVDKREHIAGNAFDYYDDAGILVHRYGPHIFHTNSSEVFGYLSRFTQWRPYEHRVLASVDNLLVPIPINLTTINSLYNLNLDSAGMQDFLAARAVPNSNIRTSEDIVISRVGTELYNKFFRNYTRKQWGLDPSELDASVAGRIPVRLDTDDRYFTDTYQAMPVRGFTEMFARMLDSKNITTRVATNYAEVLSLYPEAKIIFTGPVDEFFDYKYGPLPYRSLEFRHETYDVEKFQPAAVINHPNDQDYTRVTEFKYLTGQVNSRSSVVYEHPKSEGDPYYPIPRPENAELYAKYKRLVETTEGVHFVGRLATYKYYNMDQVVAQALSTYRKISEHHPRTENKVPNETAVLAAASF